MKNLFNRLFRRRSLDADVREELETHVAMRAELNRQGGMTEDDAIHAARRQFGNATSIREQIYHFNGFVILDDIGRDLRSGLRTLYRYRGVTSLALLSLALGIGANTMAFSFVNALIFRTLPYPSPHRLVVSDDDITPADCLALREQAADVFEEIGCSAVPSGASVAEDNPGALLPEYLLGLQFTSGVARALAVKPLPGRWFAEADESAGAERVTVISHGLWQRRFGGRADILNQTVRIDGKTAAIVGVMPDEFEFLSSSVEYWQPIQTQAMAIESQARTVVMVARLRPNVTVEQAQARMDVLFAASKPPAEIAPRNDQRRILVTRMDHQVQSQYQDGALILQGTVTFVLLIACANVAGLLLTQAVSEQKEMAVRAALGSGTLRIIRQVVVHSILLFSAGGLLGTAVGWAGVRFMVNVVIPFSINAYGPPRGGVPRSINETSVDGTVLLFTFTISVVCGLLAAIAPAVQVLRAQPVDVLRESNRSATAGIARQRLRSVFVTMQIAVAFILLVGAALMLNGLTRSLNQDIGFDTKDLLAAHVNFPDIDARKIRFNSEQMRQQLEGIDSVTAASGIAIHPPLSGAVNLRVELDTRQFQNELRPQFLPILPDYFRTLQVPIVQGREFGVRDTLESHPVAIINETAAQRYWPNENPLGKHIQIQSSQLPGEQPRQVIGVVTEVMQYSGQESRPQLYVPYSQLELVPDESLATQLRHITFIVRTPKPAPELAPAIGEAIGRVDRMQATSGIRTMRHNSFAASQRRGVFIALIAVFGAIAVVLAIAGVYGVMANAVNQRTNELGIRIALGAHPRQIRRLVIRHGGVLIGTGLIIGIVLSLALTRIIRSFLFGTSPTDPLTFVAGVILLGGVALIACYIPAWRASRIDAVVALRR